MATKTAIIFADYYHVYGLGGFTTSDGADISNAPLYVNEVDADDDATYIQSKGSKVIVLGFLADLIYQAQKIDIVARVFAPTSLILNMSAVTFETTGSTSPSTNTHIGSIYPSEENVWQTHTFEVPDVSVIKQAIEEQVANTGENVAYIVFSVGSSTTSKDTGSFKITQLYIKATYDDGSTETAPLYLKQDGAWEAITGTVFTKVNGAWVSGSLDALTDGEKVVVRVV